jgi:iron complex outermembrane receptor protein
MIKLSKQNLLLSTILIGTTSTFGAMTAYAQVEELPSAAAIADETDKDEVVVTGSRLRRDSFSSPSPLTSLNVDDNKKFGITSINGMIQNSITATGGRIDADLNTSAGNSNATEAPPAGGTGSSNVNLRGLGPERALVLLNGRRLAATGVRGAPAQPDINLIPFSMVERVDIATEAGSSVYGADAVAGTVNVILRTDFEGLEFSGTIKQPQHEGGEESTVGFLMGAQSDRARMTFGGEYYDRERIRTGDRSFSERLKYLEYDEQGNIYSVNGSPFPDLVWDGAGRGLWCATPGASDSTYNIDNFSHCGSLPVPAGARDRDPNDALSFGSNFRYFDEHTDNDSRGRADLVGELERFTLMTTGEYDLNLLANETFYTEAFYFNRQNFSRGTNEQIYPTVRGMIEQRDAAGNVTGMVANPWNPFGANVYPVITLDDFPQTRDVELQQVRFVGGVRGDIELGWFAENDWRWDAYASFDRGTGRQAQPFLAEDNLISGLNYYLDSAGEISCDSPSPLADDFGFFSPQTCVPIDLLNPSVYTGGATGTGAFATDAERDFLVGTRVNTTQINQTVFSAFVDGNLMTIPGGGDVALGVGYEYRKDSITSANSLDGVKGTIAGENPLPEGETFGSRDFQEFFAEIDIPLVQGRPGIELLRLDGAIRFTEESNYGNGTTYRVRGQYKPVDWLSLSGGFGTSFRAPNLRESFLADQGGGAAGGGDPCLNQNIQAAIANGGETNPGVRNTIDNCIADGVAFTDTNADGNVDTTVLGTSGVTTINTFTGGNSDLNPETSETLTVTASFEQPWYDGFDFQFAVSYYDISIEDSIEQPTLGDLTANCYQNLDFPNQSHPFCTLLTRGTSTNPAVNQLRQADVSFFNIGEITSEGLDFNTRLGFSPFTFQGDEVEWILGGSLAYQISQEQQTFNISDRDDNVGEIGTPEIRANISSLFNWRNLSLGTQHRYIGDGVVDNQAAFTASGFFPGQPLTRSVDFVDSVWYHDASLTYDADSWAFTMGINNLFDKEPPLIGRGASQRNNAVSSSGYDFVGRSFFATVRKAF